MKNADLLLDIIEHNKVDTLFQPIADLKTGKIIGYEAYSRGPEGTELYMPAALISEAKSRLIMNKLDGMFVENVLNNAKKRGITGRLFINIDPTFVLDEGAAEQIERMIDKCGLNPENIVVEFTEKSPVCAFDVFVNAAEKYRRAKIQICFDNISSVYSDLYILAKLKPDFMKIDRKLVENIQSNENNRETIMTMAKIAGVFGTRLLAEGVETGGELEALIRMGVSAAQGMFIGRPGRYFTGISKAAVEIIENAQKTACG